MKKYHLWSFLLITFLGFITYANTLGNGFVSDDIGIIVQNKVIGDPSFFLSVPMAIIQPFLYFSIYHLWGINAVPFHLLNILFHLATACLLYMVAFIISKKRTAALMAAIIFVVHPAISEGVSWITGGNYPQYAFFMTLAIILYLLKRQNRGFLVASVVFFILALLSSQKAVVLPLILGVYELCFGSVKKSWKSILPFIAVGIAYSLSLFLKIGGRVESLQTDYYIQGGRFENPLLKLPFAITSYIQLLFFPARLTLYHSEVMGYIEYAIRIGGLILFLALIVYAYKKDRHIFFWLMFFILNVLLVLTPLKVTSTIAERYMYYASFGIIVSVVLGIEKISKQFKIQTLILCLAGIAIFILMARTFIRNFDWRDELTLWTQTVKTSPNDFSVHNNLGAAYARINEDEKAVQEFQNAVALHPGYADAYKNLGFVYLKHEDADTALQFYLKALSLNPRHWDFYNDVGAAYIAKKDYAHAEEYFLKALTLSPENELLYLNLGRIYIFNNKKEQARAALEKVLMINPNNMLASQLLKSLQK